MQLRSTAQRVVDTKRRLASEANVWIATASADGDPHLVALSLCWNGEHLLATTPATMPVARNIAATGRARAALDSALDVVSLKCSARSTALSAQVPERGEELADALARVPTRDAGGGEHLIVTLARTHGEDRPRLVSVDFEVERRVQ